MSNAIRHRAPVTTLRPGGFRVRPITRLLALLWASSPFVPAWALDPNALPTGGVVVGGSATLQSGATRLDVNQTSQRVAIDWATFNIGTNAQVNFSQPNSSSVALNRVLTGSASEIAGKLTANGQVFLVNPAGVLFSHGAQVDVGGLAASTLNISTADFMAGRNTFVNGGAAASIINNGRITASDGGYVALLGTNVQNNGVIVANLGTVALGAGDRVSLDLAGDGLIKLNVDQAALNAQVANRGLIQADGGQVLLNARAANALLETVVNNEGVIQARTLQNRSGVIQLLGGMDGGTVNVAGTLDASAPNGGDGGHIDTSGAHVQIADAARVTTLAAWGKSGDWLIDPADYTIAATGGNMTGAVLSTSLGNGNVTILSSSGSTGTSGAVNVNDVVAWSANKLTLNAQNNININSSLNASGTASVALEYGQGAVASGNTSDYVVRAAINLPAGNNFSTKLGSDGVVANYTVITSLGAARSTTASDLQGMNVGLTGKYVLGSNIDATATSGWNGGAGFTPIGNYTGTFDGLGHAISNVTINRSSENNVGLFGYAGPGSVIRNVGVIGGSVGGGHDSVGGLVGTNYGTVSSSYATGSVSGGYYVGGLVGQNYGAVSNSYATGSVSGSFNYIGGLVGVNGSGTSTISNSYATGSVSGSFSVGGLVGANGSSGSASVSNSYSTGSVTGSGGGLVGQNNGTVSNSYWDTTTSGKATSAGGTGKTTAQMQTASSFTGFTFTTTPGASGNNWVIVDADGTLNNAGSAAGATYPMLASEYSTTINNAHQLQLMAMAPAASYTLGANIDALSTGNSKSVWGGTGFVPIGNSNNPFTGMFDGLGHTIGTLTINSPSANYVGLFGYAANGSVIRNIGLVGGSVSGNYYVGELVGYSQSSTINNGYSTGSVSGTSYVGGLVGVNSGGTVSNSYATGSVGSTGGSTGGLVGYNSSGSISNSYAVGSVNGANDVGGLAGMNYAGTITNAYAKGSVSGTTAVGGLVGTNTGYATGYYQGYSYSCGFHSTCGGSYFVQTGYVSGTVVNSYWDTSTSGQLSSAGGGTGQTTAQMQQQSNFSSWDFTNTWVGYNGYTNPLLRTFMTALTVTANNATKTYDKLAYSGGNGVTYSITPNANLLGTVSYSGTSQDATNAGTYAITPGGLYSNQQGYIIGYSNGTLTVDQAALSVTDTTASNKVYDATTAATLTGGVLRGVISGDTVTLSQSGGFASKNVGTSIVVTATDSLGGAAASNYTLTQPTGLSANITVATLAITGVTASNKTYDANTSVTLGGTAAIAALGTDNLILGGAGTGVFADKNVGTAKPVSVSGYTLSGTDAGNYVFTNPTGLSADITAKALTVMGMAATSRAYDGGTVAALTGGALSGLVSGETLNFSGQSGAFANQNVGTAKAVTVSGVALADGSGVATNYSVANPNGLTADITTKALTITGMAATSRVYDGSSVAALTGGALTGLVGTETLNFSGQSGAFADKNVAAAKTVTVSGVALADGTGLASNYSVSNPTGLAADITTKALIVTGMAVTSRVYDGSTVAALTGGTLSGLVGTETLAFSGQTGAFATQNVGTAKAVTVNGVALADGTGLASNYSVTNPTALSANITAKALIVTGMVATSRAYDGGTIAALTGGTLSGLVGTETLNFSGQTGAFATQNVGTAKAVMVSAVALADGLGLANNYSVTNPTGLVADITTKALIVTGMAATSRVYNGNAVAALTGGTLSGLVGTETLAFSGQAGTFADQNVGTAKAVTVSGVALANGTGLASNYSISNPTGLNANITAKALAISGMAATSRVYDGSTAAALTGGTLSGLVGTETLSFSGEAGTFADQNVGTAKAVTVSGVALANGTGLASNYSLTNPVGLNANITAKALAITGMVATSRSYNGNAAAALTGGTLTGLVGTETLSFSGQTGVFANKNVGTAKAVTVSGVALANGTGLASNYSVSNPTGLSANIAAKALTITGMAATSRTYDGSTVAALTGGTLSGLVGAETLNFAGQTGAFADKNVDTAKAVTVSGVALANGTGLASNYRITNPTGLVADITPKSVTAGFVAANKVYDATTAATLTGSSIAAGSVLGSDVVALNNAGATFDTQNVGSGKAVTVAGVALSGLDAGNYRVASVGNTTADINVAALSIIADDKSKTQGTANPLFTATGTGLQGGETFAALNGTLAYATPATTGSPAGSYFIAPSGVTSGNYRITFTNGLLDVIAPAPLPAAVARNDAASTAAISVAGASASGAARTAESTGTTGTGSSSTRASDSFNNNTGDATGTSGGNSGTAGPTGSQSGSSTSNSTGNTPPGVGSQTQFVVDLGHGGSLTVRGGGMLLPESVDVDRRGL